ncbi:hypothetical protein [Pseudomonas aeruginosa]|uniref:hypothetical protein n=1 Tax=Pseudomonas aeruginosa TaxID=287 RepID=UPI0020213A9A|nr:hypothetical protein [Pseudomonas aeruginosa]
MNKANECTCPSGDGSLVHPCPAHPAVEQAGGDERAAFELFVRKHCGMPAHIAVNWDAKFTNDAWAGWQARAALAQPSPAQAEAERPEVVGYRSKESGMVYEQDYGLKNPEALTTVAECERIVGALRADRDSWAEQAEQRLADWDEMRKERDAALARVAELEAKLVELEKQEPNVSAMARILSDRTATVCNVDADDHWQLYGDEIIADVNAMMEAHPYYADPVAQAQHSVPDGWLIELGFDVLDRQFRFADAKSHLPTIKIVLPACEVDDSAAWELRNSVAARIEKLIAAAPGNSVPQAWLDVQAERRRQITAEGWTPEHDDEHADGQMARAAACYALAGSSAPNDGTAALLVSLAWPWDEQWWKPSTARRDLVKACALALAEIERLDRACISQSPQPGATTASS